MTMHGRVMKRGEKLKSYEVADGCTNSSHEQVTRRRKTQGQEEQGGEESSRKHKGHQSRSSRRKQRVSKVRRLRSATGRKTKRLGRG